MPTRTPLPTGTAAPESTAGQAATRPPAAPPTATPTPEPTDVPPIATLTAVQREALQRFGGVGALDDLAPAAAAGLRYGHYAFWRTSADLPDVPDTTVWQTVRLGQIGEWGEWPGVQDEMEKVLQAQRGAYWLVGNEPDVPWQDGVTAEAYAEAYHDIYAFIKERDPSAQVAAGGIALPTPLRLRYLDAVLAHYEATYGEPLPTDLWHIHAFTLREERDSWGIGIPPGFDEAAGQLYEIEDHGDIELMKQHVVAFRDWMAANGYHDAPLAVTEFGILLPNDYGFPPEFVAQYMRDAFDYFRTARGPTGLPADDDRLVQVWFWYSVFDPEAYGTGNLFDGRTGELTPLGEAYQAYVSQLISGR